MEENRQLLMKYLDKVDLPEVYKKMMRWRYNLTRKPHTFREVAQEFGVSRQRIQQIEKEVIAKIKNQKEII